MGTHPIFESDFDCLTVNVVEMSSSISLFELAVEAAVKIPFEEVDEFFLSRGQLVPEDDLIIKCANATLPALPVIEAIELEFEEQDEDNELGCQCAQFKNINQSGFMIFATWICRIHGSGTVSVKWSQRRVTSFSCHCTPNEHYLFMCRHAVMLLKRRIKNCPYSIENQLAPLTNILMDLSVHELEETLLTVTQWELSGKDIFDLDFDVVDPIECIPDLTMDNEAGMHYHWMPLNQNMKLSYEVSHYDRFYRAIKSLAKLAQLSSSLPEVVFLFKDLVQFCNITKNEMRNLSLPLYALLMSQTSLHPLKETFESIFPDLVFPIFSQEFLDKSVSILASQNFSLSVEDVVETLVNALPISLEVILSFVIPILCFYCESRAFASSEYPRPSMCEIMALIQPSILHLETKEVFRIKNCLTIALA